MIDTKKNKKHEIVVLGPVSVLPDYQNKGIGSKLILHTIQRAKELGYKAILLCGDPDYYKKFGFKESKKYNITNAEGKFPVALLILELFPKALNDVEGMYLEDDIYNISEYELEDFDKNSKKKKKK
ncbi:GNAT family N-acetyltransferase [Apibacter raozihei]|uniref:GNAT family N-acetyltransferase n=1 Tax=Apibacter raozihei TaxID=2500547 RepID=UPI0029395440|nr:N-acetyltransferase [Apibacter raozihei]